MKRLFAILLTAAVAEEDKKVLNWYIAGEVTTMDSGKTYDTLSSEAVSYFVDTLYRLDQAGEPIPSLAAGLPEISEDGLTVTVTIRDDAHYANGDRIVAADVEYAVKRVFDPAVGSQNTSIAAIKNKDAVRAGELGLDELGVKALSDTQIEFTLEAADPYITKKLADSAYAPVQQAFAEAQGENYGLSADALLASGAYSLADWNGTDFAARWEHLRQANQYLIDNAVVVPLEQEVKGYLVNPALKGYITHQLGNSTFDLIRAYFEAE